MIMKKTLMIASLVIIGHSIAIVAALNGVPVFRLVSGAHSGNLESIIKFATWSFFMAGTLAGVAILWHILFPESRSGARRSDRSGFQRADFATTAARSADDPIHETPSEPIEPNWKSPAFDLYFSLTNLLVRTQRHLDLIGAIGNNGPGLGWTRYAFSDEETAAHQYAEKEMRDCGFITRVDHFGNLHGQREAMSGAPWVLVGTHLDTVLNGGNYDGVVGFITGLEAARLARTANLPINIHFVVFRAEESTRFGKSCLGSRAAFGRLVGEQLEDLPDTLNYQATFTLRHALAKAGLNHFLVGQATLCADKYRAYIETHIEQARVLETEQALGVVTKIRTPERRFITVTGKGCQCAAAAMICEVERVAQSNAFLGVDVVATVGRVDDFYVGADKINAIPGKVAIPLASPLTEKGLEIIRVVGLKRGIRVQICAGSDGTKLLFLGTTDHSGGTPMGWQHRKDALVAASEAVLELSEAMLPAPPKVSFYLDLRSANEPERNRISGDIRNSWKQIAANRSVQLSIGEPSEQTKPVTSLDLDLQSMMMKVGSSLGVKMVKLPSGAGHDAVIAAQAGIPTSMLFVPSVNGLSHNPNEFTQLGDIVRAVRVQFGFLEALSKEGKLASNTCRVEDALVQ
jgi:hypothetical protein